MDTKIKSYENLIVWQKAMDLVVAMYKLTEHFPQKELYGLISQMRRSAIFIPSNIAEGSRRGTRKDFRSFLINAYGSGAELETQLKITRRLKYGKITNYKIVDELLNEIMRILNAFIKKLKY